jgi:hypothetical protein
MKYLPHTNTLCLEYSDFVQPGICNAKGTYDSLKANKKIKVYGRGGNGSEILIEYETLPNPYKLLVDEKYSGFGGVYEYMSSRPILKLVSTIPAARQFYATYTLATGASIPLGTQVQYARQADWLEMMLRVLEDKCALKDILKIDVNTFWDKVIALHQVDKPVNPKLPVTYDTLRKKLNAYKAEGYKALISRKFGNQNTRVVTPKIENLILSLYCMNHKPYLVEVCNKYRDFMKGQLQVVDMITGEVFDPQEFYVKGEAYVLGESTVDYYIKKPVNIATIDQQRMSRLQWKSKYHPHVMRKSPVYSFSKVTMDDVDIPFKDHTGGRPVKSYQIYDVASGAIIGKAFSRDKNVELLREALRDMYQLILCNGWGMPLEIEMERHLTRNLMGKEIKGAKHEAERKYDEEYEAYDVENEEITLDILSRANLFKHVHVCMGTREKRAEHLIRSKKYQFQNKRPGFQGRFYARLVTNRVNQDDNRIRYAYEQIIQNELDDIDAFNNSLHPKQEQYPGMTRWEVLESCQNPNTIKYPVHTVMPFIGHKVETSVRAGYVEVQYNKYRLRDINDMNVLTSPNVSAYYIPSEDGIEKVYIYQEGKFISECSRMERFQEAKAEQTEADQQNAQRQWGYQKSFDGLVKRKRAELSTVGTGAFTVEENTKEAEVIGEESFGMAQDDINVPVVNPISDAGTGRYEGGYKQKKGSLKGILPFEDDAKSRAIADI